MLVSRCLCRDSYKDNEERDQGRPEGDLSKCGKSPAVAVEEEREDVHDLIADKHVPWMDCTMALSSIRWVNVTWGTHKSG